MSRKGGFLLQFLAIWDRYGKYTAVHDCWHEPTMMTIRRGERTMNGLKLGVAVLLMAALGLAACLHAPNKGKGKVAGPTPEELKQLVQKKEAEDPFLRTQVDVAMEAHRTRPGSLEVMLKNKTAGPLFLGPKCFGLIVPGGERKVIPAAPQSQHLFPVGEVAPGGQVSGELIFPSDKLVAGAWLVFRHPTCRPARARIE
jgi:hypothetical protein